MRLKAGLVKTGMATLAVVMLAACGQTPEQSASGQAASAAESAAASAPQPPAPPKPVQGVARKVSVKNDLFDFDYAYPAAAGAIPALKSWLDADLDRARRDVESQAKDGAKDAKDGGYPFNPYASGVDWAVVADLPGWLSLSAAVYDFSGGAHPNHGYTALIWDKAAGQKRQASDLFASKAALSAAIRAPFCDALDKQRAKRRGAPVNRASGDEFDACIDPVESALILGSAGHQAFDRIGVLVGPYEAGPYAEGDYEITLPVTDKVLAAVKPEYRGAFAVRK